MSGCTLVEGARNAVVTCLGVGAADKVLIMTDRATETVGRALLVEAMAVSAQTTIVRLEDFGVRPFSSVPGSLAEALRAATPTVTIFAAQGQPGEIRFRIELLPFLTEQLRVRHGHMIGIDEQLMTEGMCADYREIEAVTLRVFERVAKASSIAVTSRKGSRLVATFDPLLRWKPCTGIFRHAGEWGNLPEGEVFTSPANLNGIVVADVLGDYFSSKYGVLRQPAVFAVVDSLVTEIKCADKTIEGDLRQYLHSTENGNRVGEFAIGTNIGLKALTGNLLQDEKIPGVHIAFGNPYPDETGARWQSAVHVDVIPTDCTIEVDGSRIMVEGQFLPEVMGSGGEKPT